MNLPSSLDQHQRSAWRVAMLAWVLLIALGLAWELWLAPLRAGGSWLAFKVLPLVLLSAPLLRASTYAMQLALMLVLVYVFEGAARLLEPAPIRWLAAAELLLALVFFVAAIVYLRPLKRAALARRAATGERPSPPHGRSKAGEVPLGGTARSAREQPSPPHGRPKAGEVPLGGTARSAREQP